MATGGYENMETQDNCGSLDRFFYMLISETTQCNIYLYFMDSDY